MATATGLFALLAVVGSVVTGVAASNAVPASRASDLTATITANDLKPAECAGLSPTSVVAITTSRSGGSALVLGTAANETNAAGGGSDCVLGGAGNDTLNGGPGPDVIIGGEGDDVLTGGNGNDFLYGGNGNDTLNGGAHTDFCDGGAGTDSQAQCETLVGIP